MSLPRRGRLIDLGLTVGVIAAMSITVTVAAEPRSRPVDAGAYLLASLSGSLVGLGTAIAVLRGEYAAGQVSTQA